MELLYLVMKVDLFPMWTQEHWLSTQPHHEPPESRCTAVPPTQHSVPGHCRRRQFSCCVRPELAESWKAYTETLLRNTARSWPSPSPGQAAAARLSTVLRLQSLPRSPVPWVVADAWYSRQLVSGENLLPFLSFRQSWENEECFSRVGRLITPELSACGSLESRILCSQGHRDTKLSWSGDK